MGGSGPAWRFGLAGFLLVWIGRGGGHNDLALTNLSARKSWAAAARMTEDLPGCAAAGCWAKADPLLCSG
jgi:hypothetical protein